MTNHKQKTIGLYRIVLLILALTLVTNFEGAIVLAFVGAFIAGVMTVFKSPVSESPAEFLVLTYLNR